MSLTDSLSKYKAFITTKWNSGMTGKVIAIVVVGATVWILLFLVKQVKKVANR